MVLANINYLLTSFVENSSIQTIIFCWVMDEQNIIDDIVSQIAVKEIDFHTISLVATEEKIINNIQKDIDKGLRTNKDKERSIARLRKYDDVDSLKIDVSNLEPLQVAKEICTKLNIAIQSP